MKKKVLIVDDTLSWLKFNENLVETFFPKMFDITTANSAWEARMTAVDNLDMPFDVVLTDLQMEKYDDDTLAGEWLIQQLKAFKEYKKTKFLIISGMSSIKNIAERNNAAFISKPSLVSNNNAMRMVSFIKKTIL